MASSGVSRIVLLPYRSSVTLWRFLVWKILSSRPSRTTILIYFAAPKYSICLPCWPALPISYMYLGKPVSKTSCQQPCIKMSTTAVHTLLHDEPFPAEVLICSSSISVCEFWSASNLLAMMFYFFASSCGKSQAILDLEAFSISFTSRRPTITEQYPKIVKTRLFTSSQALRGPSRRPLDASTINIAYGVCEKVEMDQWGAVYRARCTLTGVGRFAAAHTLRKETSWGTLL